MSRNICGVVILCAAFFAQGCYSLQCFVCTANLLTKKDCRSLSAARLIDCPDSSDHCNAIVTDIDGQVIVHRGCSGNVDSWGFGESECDIMTSDRLLDRAVAFYQCRGDGCNNIEPGDITTVTQVINDNKIKVPKFSMSSSLKSEQTVDDNTVSKSHAIMTNQEDDLSMRKGKQLNGDDSEDDPYGGLGPGRKRTAPPTTTTTEVPVVFTVQVFDETTTEAPTTRTTTTTTTTKRVTSPRPKPVVTTAPVPVTRPSRRRFTIFDRR